MENEGQQWIVDDSGQYEYHLEANREGNTHQKAELACSKIGGVLASLKSSSTQELIQNLIPPAQPGNGTRQFWIGVHRETQTSSWVWEDGAPLNYSNWYPNEELLNSQSPENCASIFTSSFNYKWFSNHCEGNQFGYICERPIGGFMSTTNLLPTTLKQDATDFNGVLVEQDSNVVLQIALPILLTLLLLLLIIGIIYSHKKKHGQSLCTWIPMSPAPRQPKEAMNDYVDLPPGQATGNDSSSQMQTSNQESYFEIESEIRTKPKSKSHLDNPTYMQLDIPSRSKTLQSDEYTVLRSIDPSKIKHSSSGSPVKHNSLQRNTGYVNINNRNKKFQNPNHFKQSKPAATSRRDDYVDVYSLSTKMKRKK